MTEMRIHNRTEDNGIYVYPKEAWDYRDGQWDIELPPVKWKAFRGTSERTTDRWMEKHCDPGSADRGVESDWLRFNYELWTTGSDKYTAYNIVSVIDRAANTYGGFKWNYLEESAEDLFSRSKAFLYHEKGQELGVDHYSN